jgi:hypothetical protein
MNPPARVSGVWVDGVFRPTPGSGAYAHRVDYPGGRVVFDSPVPASSVVRCEYSYRLFQVQTADAPAFQDLQEGSFRPDDPQFALSGSGAWDVPSSLRAQLPCVFVEATADGYAYGTQIGGGDTHRRDVLFHVLAEDRPHKNWMADVLLRQFEKRVPSFDRNEASRRDLLPLDAYGGVRPSGMLYPDLVKPAEDGGCGWRQLRVVAARGADQPRVGRLFHAAVRASVEVDLPVA